MSRGCGLIAAASMAWGAVLSGAPAPEAAHRPRPPSLVAASYADGAPVGFSGGFGEPSCHACHFDADVNTEPGRVAIDGVPERFLAGAQYPITVTLTRPGMVLGGFQLTVRLETGATAAGTLAPADEDKARVSIELQTDTYYASHRREGTMPVEPDTVRWTMVWTAPETVATVRFHVSANAADGDDTISGDYVYTGDATARISSAADTGP